MFCHIFSSWHQSTSSPEYIKWVFSKLVTRKSQQFWILCRYPAPPSQWEDWKLAMPQRLDLDCVAWCRIVHCVSDLHRPPTDHPETLTFSYACCDAAPPMSFPLHRMSLKGSFFPPPPVFTPSELKRLLFMPLLCIWSVQWLNVQDGLWCVCLW